MKKSMEERWMQRRYVNAENRREITIYQHISYIKDGL